MFLLLRSTFHWDCSFSFSCKCVIIHGRINVAKTKNFYQHIFPQFLSHSRPCATSMPKLKLNLLNLNWIFDYYTCSNLICYQWAAIRLKWKWFMEITAKSQSAAVLLISWHEILSTRITLGSVTAAIWTHHAHCVCVGLLVKFNTYQSEVNWFDESSTSQEHPLLAQAN